MLANTLRSEFIILNIVCICLHEFVLFLHTTCVVGNNSHSGKATVVQTEDALKFANQLGLQLYETDVKYNLNVDEVLVGACRNKSSHV